MPSRPALLLALAICLALVTACGQSPGPTAAPTTAPAPVAKPPSSPSPAAGGTVPKQWSSPPPMTIDQNKSYTAVIDTTHGQVRAELFPKEAPNTVNNFVFLAREGFYDGVVFHRIIKGFMVQTGDPTGTGRGGPGYRFADELPKERRYTAGTLAMANAGKDTQGSQFFIMHADYQLQPNYTIFGKLASGQDVLEKIATTPVRPSPQGEPSVPTERVQINSIKIEEK